MQKQKIYKTRQRQRILQALQALPSRHATAEDVLDYLKAQDEEVGIATIYRNLDKLVNEGLVLKYTLPDGVRACYQFLDSCDEQKSHCHVICTECREVSHLECKQMELLASHLLEEHHLLLDHKKTVLYGLCTACANNHAGQ